MSKHQALPRSFYDRDAMVVARELLGMRLCRRTSEGLAGGSIVEVEAYLGREDAASHSYRGLTRRNEVMFGPPGHLYVYAIHAKFCMNAVTEAEGTPTAVLIRALEPQTGIELMRRRRGRDEIVDLARGPARLCQALAIDGRNNGMDLAEGRGVWIEEAPQAGEFEIAVTTRIGVTSAQEEKLRFFVVGNRHVSGTRKQNAGTKTTA